jgi:hypothetical protein
MDSYDDYDDFIEDLAEIERNADLGMYIYYFYVSSYDLLLSFNSQAETRLSVDFVTALKE